MLPRAVHRAAAKRQKALRAEFARRSANTHTARPLTRPAPSELNRKEQWELGSASFRRKFGLGDRASVKRTLEEWRRTVSKARQARRYTGDLAFDEHDPTAPSKLDESARRRTQKTPVSSKKPLRRRKSKDMDEEDATGLLHQVQDSAMARSTAPCPAASYRWQDAFADLKRHRAGPR